MKAGRKAIQTEEMTKENYRTVSAGGPGTAGLSPDLQSREFLRVWSHFIYGLPSTYVSFWKQKRPRKWRVFSLCPQRGAGQGWVGKEKMERALGSQ